MIGFFPLLDLIQAQREAAIAAPASIAS